jgi:hypothetical protein
MCTYDKKCPYKVFVKIVTTAEIEEPEPTLDADL